MIISLETWKYNPRRVLVIGRCFNNPAHKTIHLQKVSRQFTCIYMFLLESSKKPFTGPCKRAQNLHPFWTLTCFFRKMYGTFQRLGFSQNDAKTLICCMPFQLFRVPSRKHWARWNSVLAAGSFLPERGSCPPKIEESPDKCPKFVDIQISSWSFTLHLFNPLRKTRSFGSFSNGTVDVVFRAYARKHGSTSITWKPPVMGWRVLRCHCVVRRKPGATWCPAIRTKSISRCGLWSLKMEGCFCLTFGIFEEGERPARGDSLLFSMFIGIDWFIFNDRWCNLKDLRQEVGDDWWLSLARKRPRAKGLPSLQICLCWTVRAHQTWGLLVDQIGELVGASNWSAKTVCRPQNLSQLGTDVRWEDFIHPVFRSQELWAKKPLEWRIDAFQRFWGCFR